MSIAHSAGLTFALRAYRARPLSLAGFRQTACFHRIPANFLAHHRPVRVFHSVPHSVRADLQQRPSAVRCSGHHKSRYSLRLISQSTSHSSRSKESKQKLPLLVAIILGTTLGIGILTPWASFQVSELEQSINRFKSNAFPLDPMDALLPDSLAENSTHLHKKSTIDLLRSYLTLWFSEIPSLVTYGPILLNSSKSVCDNVPVVGPIIWTAIKWLIHQTFFFHYTGGTTPEDCQKTMAMLYAHQIGTLLNYSVEGPEDNQTTNVSKIQNQVCEKHIKVILRAVEAASNFSASLDQKYPVGSAKMNPTAIALKISGLVTDPYLFKRASDSLILNHKSPFDSEGDPFPTLSGNRSQIDPLSSSDRLTLESLIQHLREISIKARAANVILMIDAEYSWFQPALDRIATFLSKEFNQVVFDKTSGEPEFYSPTIFNTFQALLRSTPQRLEAFIKEAERKGFSIGIKLVRGAYLMSETNHWREELAKEKINSSDTLPVWNSKDQTDQCYDALTEKLVKQLCYAAKYAEKGGNNLKENSPLNISLMIAGHNANSILKALKQIRDKEGLAFNDSAMNNQRLYLSDSLRGRIMFAQLYGMADNLTNSLVNMLVSNMYVNREEDESHKISQLQPFVYKYLPFGPVDKILPYLARRAEENQSILKSGDPQFGVTGERRAIAKELKRRLIPIM
ncbi:hypothetical protein O181_018634 [Austropuccinia psidii MF-1]|uniref:Proline dehydrogenase n=1 Tax=Austropuccinia psidii MF-1 TaxID=1389203 RepID=A0A9Q3C5M1_9BASI|nr:hypothetical protein [Austropuccinia psidii MF-1]